MKRIICIILASVLCFTSLTAFALKGDVNGDSVPDSLDAAQILSHSAKLLQLDSAALAQGDVNNDGKTDSLDAAMILRYDAELIDEFPTAYVPQKQYGTYTVKRFESVNSIDWTVVDLAPIDTYKWVNSVEYEAYAQLVYVEDWGFVCRMTCMESDPPAQYTQFGDPVYLDSCMEFFAAFDGQRYINIESNSIGALVCQFGAAKANRQPATNYLTMANMIKTNPAVEDDYWTLTIELPLTKLQAFYGSNMTDSTFSSGYSFKGNFYKIGSDPQTGVRHYGMWNEVGGTSPDFHQPSYFGTIVME